MLTQQSTTSTQYWFQRLDVRPLLYCCFMAYRSCSPFTIHALLLLLLQIAVPRDVLRSMLPKAVNISFNALSIDSDQSTSDTVVAVSSGAVECPESAYPAFQAALTDVCAALSEDIVRNGEGVQHVIKVKVSGATTEALARAVGKSIVNSPLFKCAVAGNDPNVGRLVAAIGKCVGSHPDGGRQLDMSKSWIKMGGLEVRV